MKSGARVPAQITQRVRTDGSIASDFLVDGVNNVDAYVRGRMILGSAINLQAGYVFKKRLRQRCFVALAIKGVHILQGFVF